MDSTEGGIVVTNVAVLSLVSEVKEKKDLYPILLELKANVHMQKDLAFEQWGYDVIRYQEKNSFTSFNFCLVIEKILLNFDF